MSPSVCAPGYLRVAFAQEVCAEVTRSVSDHVSSVRSQKSALVCFCNIASCVTPTCFIHCPRSDLGHPRSQSTRRRYPGCAGPISRSESPQIARSVHDLPHSDPRWYSSAKRRTNGASDKMSSQATARHSGSSLRSLLAGAGAGAIVRSRVTPATAHRNLGIGLG